MITFITSLRHPDNCNGPFERVRDLLDHTLRSICRQSIPNYRVIVVVNAPFIPSFTHESIDYLTVDYPPPSTVRASAFGMPGLRVDRGCKYLAGLIAARRRPTDHVMFVDADDYVSSRLAAHSQRGRSHNGWFLRRGYVYDRSSGEFGTLDDFHLRCGTGHIVAARLLPVPEHLNPDVPRDTILSSVPESYLLRVLGSHRWMAEHLAAAGTPLAPLPFGGAVYHIGHGENHTARSGALTVRPADLSERVRREFGIPFQPYAPAPAGRTGE